MTEKAYFGAGCFWGVEAAFRRIQGVVKTAVGYAGGHTKNPTYEQVCTDRTGHAEVVEVEYDPSRVSYERLLEAFWECNDPTQLNRQGGDIGTQYRSAIFPLDDAQRAEAEAGIARAQQDRSEPVVTTIEGPAEWFPAEDYHQEYWDGEGQRNPYCLAVIPPKLMKLRKSFAARVKS